MTGYAQRTKEELQQLKKELEKQYEDAKGKGLKLDMSRGKPSAAQLDLSMGIMDVLTSESVLKTEAGLDCRNYGVLDGIPEAKKLMADMMEVAPGAGDRVRQFQPEYHVRHRIPVCDPWRIGKHTLGQGWTR